MARVSLDDMSSAESSKSGPSRPARDTSGGGKSAKAGASLDPKQKIKAAVALAVIVVAGGFIVWNTGLLDSGSPQAASGPPDATAEQIQAYNEEVQRQEEQQRRSGNNTREVPMPLGAN